MKEADGTVLRGGAFKPRSSPYSFQGMGEEALKYLAEAREQTGLPIITEVMDSDEIDLVCEYADILQVGARNTQNYSLLKALGKARKPVFLKRGMSSTIQELLMSAEYILSGGNMQVMVGERGIRTFETATRFTFDVNAIPVLKELTHLPVVADPAALGRIEIPRIGVSAIVKIGSDEQTLSRAVGLVPQSARPGQIGNVVLAGHRDTFFRPLRDIQVSDRIRVRVPPETYEYKVESVMVVSPEDTNVLRSKGKEEITLVTCFPFRYIGPSPDRFVVSATRVN